MLPWRGGEWRVTYGRRVTSLKPKASRKCLRCRKCVLRHSGATHASRAGAAAGTANGVGVADAVVAVLLALWTFGLALKRDARLVVCATGFLGAPTGVSDGAALGVDRVLTHRLAEEAASGAAGHSRVWVADSAPCQAQQALLAAGKLLPALAAPEAAAVVTLAAADCQQAHHYEEYSGHLQQFTLASPTATATATVILRLCLANAPGLS